MSNSFEEWRDKKYHPCVLNQAEINGANAAREFFLELMPNDKLKDSEITRVVICESSDIDQISKQVNQDLRNNLDKAIVVLKEGANLERRDYEFIQLCRKVLIELGELNG